MCVKEKREIEKMALSICKSRMVADVDDCRKCSQHERGCLYQDIACGLYREGYRKQSEWISIDDRLPEENGQYLCFRDGYIDVCGFALNLKKIDEYDFYCADYSGWYSYDRDLDCYNVIKVTHWMPIPEAPKMKGGAE